MDNVSIGQRPVIRHEVDTILQDEAMCVCLGLDIEFPDDLVEALHRQIEDKTFIHIDLPLLIIREGTQRKDVAPVRILEDLGIDYIGQCNFGVTFIQRKDDGWLRRGGCDGLDFEVYHFIEICQLEAAVGSNDLFISCHVLGSVDVML